MSVPMPISSTIRFFVIVVPPGDCWVCAAGPCITGRSGAEAANDGAAKHDVQMAAHWSERWRAGITAASTVEMSGAANQRVLAIAGLPHHIDRSRLPQGW